MHVLNLIFGETYEPQRDESAQTEVQQWAREALADGHAQIAELLCAPSSGGAMRRGARR